MGGVKCVFRGWAVCLAAANPSEQHDCECFEMGTDQVCFHQPAGCNRCDCYRAQQIALEACGKGGEI